MKIILKNNYYKLVGIILISLLIDNFLSLSNSYPPAWDQGFHLSNVFKMYNILNDYDMNLFSKIDQILNITDNYRGPLTYFLSALFLKLFKNTYHYAYLSNQLFNIICLISIYELSKVFKNKSSGLFAALLFTFSSLIISQKSDYLIDLSLTSFSCLNLLFFTKWFEGKENIKYSIL